MGKRLDSGFETKITYKILKLLLYTLLLTSIWVWSDFLFPFITSKVLYFRLGVELLLVFYIPLALKYPELRPRWNWLLGAVWIYLGVLIVTSIFGVNFYKSFWGTVERGEGIVTMLHFGIYFTILASVLKTAKDWRRYLTASLMVISFTGILSLGQLGCGSENVEGLCRFVPPAQGTRVSSTIGNAAFYAAFMLYGIFLSLLLGFESKSRGARFVFFANALFNGLLMVYTQTRGGAIALYFGVFIMFVYHIFRATSRGRRITAVVFSFLMVAMPLALFWTPQIFPQRFRDIPVVVRLAQISGSDVTTQSRLDTWKASFAGFGDRFLVGYGYENYNIAFNKYFPSRIFKDAGSQIWFDRAHNTVLDVAVTSGVVGVVLYFAIFFFAFRILYRVFREPSFPSRSAVILAVLLLGYFVQNLFVFDTHATYLMFFLVLSYLVFLENSFARKPINPNVRVFDFHHKATAVIVIVMAVCAYFINILPAKANMTAIAGFKAVREGQLRQLEPAFRKAMSYGTYMDEEIRQHMIEYVRQVGGSGQLSDGERKSLYAFTAAELEKNLAEAPKDAKNYLYLMNFYNITVQDTNKLDRVFELGREALNLSPTRMQLHFELGQAAFIMGRYEEGLEYFRKGLELNPEPKESHINYLTAAIFAKRTDIASQELLEIKRRGFILTAKEEASVANGFAASCDVASAREHVEAAVRLEPQYAEQAAVFIADLEQRCR